MHVVDLRIIEYSDAMALQNALVDLRRAGKCGDVLLLLEHPPTVTLGTRATAGDVVTTEALLSESGVSLYRTDRGGMATYHGPGQLVGYPIIHLRAAGLSARAYVRKLEEVLLRTLHTVGVSGLRDDARPGIWIDRTLKIASIGVRIRHGIASHGFSLNVHLDRNPAELVVCCGERETLMVSVQDLVPTPVEMTVVRSALVQAFSEVFARELVPCSREDLPAAAGP